MNKANNARVCELYLEFDQNNIEHASAQEITKNLLKSHNYREALDVFLNLAKEGDRTFQHNAGVLYQCIDEVRDYQSALACYKKSAAQDFAPAKERLGSMYEFGDGGTPVDLSAAIKLYQESSDQGNLHSTYNLGMILATGNNCSEKNVALALPLLLEAAHRGHALMKINLGITYLEDCKNSQAANHWFKLAFEQDPFVSVDLGHYYLSLYNARQSEMNSTLSHYWFSTAVTYGYQDYVLDILNGDQVAMSSFKVQGQLH